MHIRALALLFSFYGIATFAAQQPLLTLRINHFRSAFALQQFFTNHGNNPEIIEIPASPATTTEAVKQALENRTGLKVVLTTVRTGALVDQTVQELIDTYFEGNASLLCNQGFSSYNQK